MANWASGTYAILAGATGTSTGSNTSSTFKNTGANWPTGTFTLANFTVRILTGTGAGQTAIVSSNTSTIITIVGTWGVTPDNTSTYEIVLVFNNNDHITGSIVLSSNIISEIQDSATILVDGNYGITIQLTSTIRWNKSTSTLVTFCANNRTIQGKVGFWGGISISTALTTTPKLSYIKLQDSTGMTIGPSSGIGDCSTIHHIWISDSAGTFIAFSAGTISSNMTISNCLLTMGSTGNWGFSSTSVGAYTQTFSRCWAENNLSNIIWRGSSINGQTISECAMINAGTGNSSLGAAGQVFTVQDSYFYPYLASTSSGLLLFQFGGSPSSAANNLSRNIIYGNRVITSNASAAGISSTFTSAFNDASSKYAVSTQYFDLTASTLASAVSDNDYISGQNLAIPDNIDTSTATTSTASPVQYKNLTASRTNVKSVRNKPYFTDNVVVGTPTTTQVTITYDSQNGAVSGQGSTTVNVTSNSGQTVLSVASTTGFEIGETIEIGYGTARSETGVISSISAGVSLTLTANLTFTHTSGQADTVKKRLRILALPYIEYGTSSGNYTMRSDMPPPNVRGLIYTGIQPVYNGNTYAFNYTGHSVTLKNLSPNTTYYYNTYAVSPLGDVLTGTEGTFTTVQNIPTVSYAFS